MARLELDMVRLELDMVRGGFKDFRGFPELLSLGDRGGLGIFGVFQELPL